MNNKINKQQEIIINFLKNYGFVYQNSEIYNGLANAWDYGHLGAILKNNLKQKLLNYFVFSNPNMTLLDSSIILNPLVWEASGHLNNFSDPLIDCKNCKNRFRADKLLEQNNIHVSDNTSIENIEKEIYLNHIKCPNCQKNNWTNVRKFNLMYKTYQGVTEENLNTLYLRPETAQGIFINFKNIARTQRLSIPFGVAQIGKSFRNEITPGNFIFRTREFEQMEIEYFVKAENALNTFNMFQNKIQNFLIHHLNIKQFNLKIYEHPKNELSHYATKTVDFEFKFPHGFDELWGLSYRSDFDLKAHEIKSKKNLKYFDTQTNQEYLPHIIEPSVGIERLFYAIISNSYCIEKLSDGKEREILKLPISLSPYKFAILPLTNKLNNYAEKLYTDLLNKGYICYYDSSGSIGKRYRRMDAIGTPYCLTIDFDTIENNTVTIRNRDTMNQEKINLDQLKTWLINKIM